MGLAIARELQLTGLNTLIIESASDFGRETSSRNSEVIHAGIYYPKDSLKAQLCVAGNKLLYDYCLDRHIPHKKIGKLIVAVDSTELDKLNDYYKAALLNGVTDLLWLDSDEVLNLEPNINCIMALHSPSTGIINSHSYMMSLLADFLNGGGLVSYNSTVDQLHVISNKPCIKLKDGYTLSTDILINSAGLYAPNIYNLLPSPDHAIAIPNEYCIGHYYTLSQSSPFNRLIYPVAVSGGLGTHVTLDLANSVKFGPDVRWINKISYEFDDSCRLNFIDSIKRYYPSLDSSKIMPGYTGIRPKVVNNGEADKDFLIFDASPSNNYQFINLLGIESPGLTSSLAIAKHVSDMIS